MDQADEIVASADRLVRYFSDGAKPKDQLRIGMEHEKIVVRSDGSAPSYAEIARLLGQMAAHGWERTYEDKHLIALQHAMYGSVTLEPGAQLEHSGRPWPSTTEAVADNDRHVEWVSALAAQLDLRFLGVGFRPFGSLDEVPWVPKGRYRIMSAYLAPRGQKAHEMMKRTTTVQANFDYLDEADAMEKFRVAFAIGPVVTALFAASPLVDGKVSGYQSYRASTWLEMDPDRCGLLPFAFSPQASFRDYVEWALDVPMFFLYRQQQFRALDGVTFRRFMREGVDGERATLADWELHLSTLFPEVRFKRYLEVRQADAGPQEMVRALPVLWRGLLESADSRTAAWELVRDLGWDERLDLYRRTPREGLRARVRKTTLHELSRELVRISAAGLRTLPTEKCVGHLSPLERIAQDGRTVADRIVEDYGRVGGDVQKLLPLLAL